MPFFQDFLAVSVSPLFLLPLRKPVSSAMSASNQELIHSKGIYHGLPVLSDAPKGLTAIVTGANGISGAHMVPHPCILCNLPLACRKNSEALSKFKNLFKEEKTESLRRKHVSASTLTALCLKNLVTISFIYHL